MTSREMKGTKWKIFTTSIEMFAEKNYHLVSLRDIAKNVGIKASSIYNHFESKEELLDAILNYFEFYFESNKPDLDKLLLKAEQDPPCEVLMYSTVFFDPFVESMMYDVIKIVTTEMRTTERAGCLVKDYLIEMPSRYIKAVLERMLEMGRIEHIDIDLVAMMASSFCFSCALRLKTPNEVAAEEWIKGLRKIFRMVNPVNVEQFGPLPKEAVVAEQEVEKQLVYI